MSLDFLVTRVIHESSGFDIEQLKQSLQLEKNNDYEKTGYNLGLKTAI